MNPSSTPSKRFFWCEKHKAAHVQGDDGRECLLVGPFSNKSQAEAWNGSVQTVPSEKLPTAEADPLATLDWNRLMSGDRRALRAEHQPFFDAVYAASSAVAPLVTKEPISTSSMRHLPSAAPQANKGSVTGSPEPCPAGAAHLDDKHETLSAAAWKAMALKDYGGSSITAYVAELERDLAVAQGLEQMAYDQRDKAFDDLKAALSARGERVARDEALMEAASIADSYIGCDEISERIRALIGSGYVGNESKP